MPRFVDLSHDITDGMVTYPGLPAPRMGTVLSREDSRGRYADGVEFHIGSVEICTNTGTYLDTPYHRFADGHDLAGLDLARCADIPVTVIRSSGPSLGADLVDMDTAGRAVLFDTGWSQHWGTDRYRDNDHPFVGPDAVDALVSGGAALVGIDSLNIDSTAGSDRPAHTRLLAAGIPIVEHLTNLSSVPATGARFSAVPIKLAGLGTFSVRAYVVVPQRRAVCEVVFDCHDVRRLAEFWAAVLSGPSDTTPERVTAQVRSDDWAMVVDPEDVAVALAFQRVPEDKGVKNRVHLDITSDELALDTARLVALGATAIGAVVTDESGSFQVLADPEGNEFCLID